MARQSGLPNHRASSYTSTFLWKFLVHVSVYIFRLKDLEASIRSQVAAEERAHKIVEKLVLQDEISEEFLLQSESEFQNVMF